VQWRRALSCISCGLLQNLLQGWSQLGRIFLTATNAQHFGRGLGLSREIVHSFGVNRQRNVTWLRLNHIHDLRTQLINHAAVMNSRSADSLTGHEFQGASDNGSLKNHSSTVRGPIWFSMFRMRATQAPLSSDTTISNRLGDH
jgi:hypothetical protein